MRALGKRVYRKVSRVQIPPSPPNMKKQLQTQEFETTVLDINPDEIRAKLRKLGAIEKPERLMRRWVFDIKNRNHTAISTWIRLRDNGQDVTLTYKKRTGTKIGSTQEIEVNVDDFDKTVEILSKINFYRTFYQENRRQIFTLDDIEFSIDTWPKIPPYLEIEATSIERVQEGLAMLKLEKKDIGDGDVREIYSRYGVDLHSLKILKFK